MDIIRRFRIIGLLLILLFTFVLSNPGQQISATATTPDELLVIKEQLNTAYRRSYRWTIEKSVNPAVWELPAGGSGESDYTVSVTRSATVGNWSVSGVIGFRNQTDHSLIITAVEDLIMPANVAANVSCDFSFPLELPAGWLEECTFHANLPNGSPQTSIATVHLSSGSSYSKSSDFDFSNASVTESGYSSVNVVDTNGEAWATSGSASWDYSRIFTCPTEEEYYQNGVYTYNVPNTATITQTGQSDQANVIVTCYYGYKIYIPNVPVNESVGNRYDIYVGYEDLPSGSDRNDYDYNDWLVSFDTELVGPYINDVTLSLEKVSFLMKPQARGAMLDHEFHLRFPAGTFGSDGVATLTIRDVNGDPISVESIPFDADVENDILVFDCTCDPLPPRGSIVNTVESTPYTPPVMTAFLEIEFSTPAPFMFTEYLTHGDGLFFDPYIWVDFRGTFYGVGIGDVRTIVIPVKEWFWPEERVRINEAYPLVAFDPTDVPPTEWVPDWWEIFNNCIYGDGQVCSDPTYLERIKTPGQYFP
ncbi:MAG TPA: hypothetical protein VLA49_19455 [Anaerolineales bacterium]|nr:hypothetical protein [Anaerolineales bacterium]